MNPTIYDGEELALIRAGLRENDSQERAETVALLLRQPTEDPGVRAGLRDLLSDRAVVRWPTPGTHGELRLLAALALARADRLAGADDELNLRAAPAVQGDWVEIAEHEFVLRASTTISELTAVVGGGPTVADSVTPDASEPLRAGSPDADWLEAVVVGEPADRVDALHTILRRPSGEPQVAEALETMLADRSVLALTIPHRFGELRLLAAAALAAERSAVGDRRPVVLTRCPPLLSLDDLLALADAHDIATAGRSAAHIYAELLESGRLVVRDLEITHPFHLGW